MSIDLINPSFYYKPTSTLVIMSESPNTSNTFNLEFSLAANIYLPLGDIAIEYIES